MPHRIHTFGASGSGTTTLGRELARQMGGTHLDTDTYYWYNTDPPFVTKREPAKRVEMIQQDVAHKENWVLSGSICSWGDDLLDSFTTAVFVRLDPDIRMKRLAERERVRYGDRISPKGDMHKLHLEFMQWARSYDTETAPTRSLDLHQSWMQKLNCPIFEVNSKEPAEQIAMRILDDSRQR